MGKNEFLDALRRELYGLPPEEIERSIGFYAEMIDDRIEDGMSEQDAVCAMEDISIIAQRIKRDQPLSTFVRSKVKTSASPGALSIILIILGFPIWFPLLCAFLVIVLAAVIVIISLLIAIFAIVFSFCVGGLAAVASGLIHLFIQPIAGIAAIGAGLALAGLGALLVFPALYGARFLLMIVKVLGRCVKSLFTGKQHQHKPQDKPQDKPQYNKELNMNNYKKYPAVKTILTIIALLILLGVIILAMNKVVKIILSIAVICVVLGIVLMVAAWIMSGRDIRRLNGTQDMELQQFSSDGKTVSSVNVDAVSASVIFDESSDNNVYVSYYKNKNFGYEVNISNSGVLNISYHDYRPWYSRIFDFSFLSDDSVIVSLPKSFNGQMDVKSISGDITIPDLTLEDNLLVTTTSGQIRCSVPTASSARFNTTSGDIYLDSPLSCSGNISFSSVSGEISTDSIEGKEISTQTVSGDVHISDIKGSSLSCKSTSGQINLGKIEASGITFKTVSGDIDFSLAVTDDFKANTTSGEVSGTMGGKLEDYTISTSTTSGDCNLPNVSLGSKKINVSTTSGDIDINFEQH